MIIEISETDIERVSKVLESRDIRYDMKVDKSTNINWINDFLLKSLNDLVEKPGVNFSRSIRNIIYDRIPDIATDIETEILESSFTSSEKSQITLLYSYLKKYFDIYIFDALLKEKYRYEEL